ncbi:MAG: DUF294 nucleotidyltransferase-like domain-containing protein [Bacteroidota bacterium]|nr:DUF294 nucleotidyltransferase-like domain-containing protein [Bacteroidota bacterium]
MTKKNLRNFFLSIILPGILAIVFFIISIYTIIIPSFEKNMMDSKKEMIRELTNTAWSLIEEDNKRYQDSIITLEQAKKLAAKKIGKLRYGDNSKDYFWITDMHPTMVMHPYRNDLNGTDLSEYKDPHNKKLFVEAVNLVKKQDKGYIHYMWQWKDDSTKIVPKLSYVKGFSDWGWIIGTGIYLEDVKGEIISLQRRLLKISFLIAFVIFIILLFIIRQSLNIEKRRNHAEKKLKLSRQKYQALVEASTDGTLMIIDNKIIFSNKKFNKMLNCSSINLLEYKFNDLFEINWNDVLLLFDDPEKSVSIDTKLLRKKKEKKEVVISISKIKYAEQDGFIVVTKDITKQKQIEKATENLSQELQTSLLLMNQPIKHLIKSFIKCDLNTTAFEAASLMLRKKQNIIFVSQEKNIIGLINDSDLRKRIIAKGLDANTGVSNIMTSPVKYIRDNLLIYEAILMFDSENISHLAVKDNLDNFIGIISYEDVLNLQKNTLSFLVRKIEKAEKLESIKQIQKKVTVLIKALLDSGAKAQNITRIISSIADAITNRLILLSLEEFGEPPCRFAFVAMGSEGRKEQTLATDQDNAIIIEDVEKGKLENAKKYFKNFAEKMNNDLDYVGYKYCEGEVMANNPKWMQPLSVWKNYFTKWIVNSTPQNLIDSSIFFDFRCIYGEKKYTDELKLHIDKVIENKAVFFYNFAESVLNFKAPSNISGSIIKTAAPKEISFDIKKILLPVLAFIKIYSLKNNIAETNSLSRLEKLFTQDIIKNPMYDELVFSYDFLMLLRLRFQILSIFKNEQPSNIIVVNKLTDIEKTTLKKIFSELSVLQSKLSFDFKNIA